MSLICLSLLIEAYDYLMEIALNSASNSIKIVCVVGAGGRGANLEDLQFHSGTTMFDYKNSH